MYSRGNDNNDDEKEEVEIFSFVCKSRASDMCISGTRFKPGFKRLGLHEIRKVTYLLHCFSVYSNHSVGPQWFRSLTTSTRSGVQRSCKKRNGIKLKSLWTVNILHQ